MNFDPERYAAGIRKENAQEKERIQARLKSARIEAERLGRAIKAADPEVRRVFLFGSVSRADASRADFDIDLAIEGGDVHRALDVAELSDFEVDVVSLDRMPEPMRERIRDSGLELE